MSTYVKWIANSIQGDGTTHAILADGTELRQGEPVKLSADQRKELEDKLGLIFEDSSAAEAKASEQAAPEQPVGSDVVGTAPVFQTPDADTDQSGKSGKNS